MAKTKTKKGQGPSVIEDPDVLAGKTEEFFNNKRNRNLVFGLGGVIALAIAGFMIYQIYIGNKNDEAQQEMFQAVYYFEADSLGRALNGDGVNYGFLQILENYSGTEAANLANFYTGATYLKLGDFQSAIRYLDKFSSSDYLLQARAYSLIGDAHLELENYQDAIDAYQDAVDYKPNAEFTPIYLKKLAIAYEEAGNFSAAAKSFQTIIKDYPTSSLIQDAKKHKARLEGLAAG